MLPIKDSLIDSRIAIVGLGYVGLPLAIEFGQIYETFGFDININRILELKSGYDSTLEVQPEELKKAHKLIYSSCIKELSSCNIFIVTVPTPVTEHKQPDLSYVLQASRTIGTILKKNDIVIYESTVYPGATEEDFAPVLEKISGLKLNRDFFVGYSPERINPGDKKHRLINIKKITSGSTHEATEFIDKLYSSIICAGTYKVSSIRVAEAAKVIENTQRDVNIALMNEIAIIFNRLDIDFEEVLKASRTKWNFLPFSPGLVGGHCIGIDPFYLTHKAQSIGYHPEIILACRRINDSMGHYVASQLVKAMIRKSIQIKEAKILIMGLTFKENCPDLRNTRVVDIILELKEYGANIECYDPWVNTIDAESYLQITPVKTLVDNSYDSIILAVAHNQFIEMGAERIHTLCKSTHIIYDLKYILPAAASDLRL